MAAKPTRVVNVDRGAALTYLSDAREVARKGDVVLYERSGGGYIRARTLRAGSYELAFFPAGCNCGL